MSNDYPAEHGGGLEPGPEKPKPWLSNRTYDALVWVAQILLPALGTAYLGLGEIWAALPDSTPVVATIVVMDALLGTLLGISKNQYQKSGAMYDGDLNVHTDQDGNKKLSFTYEDDPYLLDKKTQVTFKINPS